MIHTYTCLQSGDLYLTAVPLLDKPATFRLRGGFWEHHDVRDQIGHPEFDPVMFTTQDPIQALLFALKLATEDLEKFVVESKPEHFNKKNMYYKAGDEKCKFISEGFLYPLLGKEDARSVLGRFRKIQNLISAHAWDKT